MRVYLSRADADEVWIAQMNIARGRRFSMIGRSAPSSIGFRAAVNPSPKNAAFTGSVALAGHPPIGMVPRSALLDDGVDDALGDVDHGLADP
jgi:hypothetical protein